MTRTRTTVVLTALLTTAIVAATLAGARGQQNPADRAGNAGALTVLPVQGAITLITNPEGNVVVQTGKDGVLVVDSPPAAFVPQMLAEIRKLTPLPLRFIINTSIDPARWGGNVALLGLPSGRGTGGAPFASVGAGDRPAILAHDAVLNRMAQLSPPAPPAAQPTNTYFLPSMDFHSNGEAVILFHRPAAFSDSDTIVHFRRSDVIAAGNIFTPARYPVIDLERGGSVAGLVSALGFILELAVPEAFEDGGTRIIPAVGRVSEETDVAEYRDMIAIIRDRIQDGIRKKMTLEQITASKPSRDYDGEYNASQADADRFVETMYRSLTATSARPGERP